MARKKTILTISEDEACRIIAEHFGSVDPKDVTFVLIHGPDHTILNVEIVGQDIEYDDWMY